MCPFTGGFLLLRNLRDIGGIAPEMDHLSLWELCYGNLEMGSLIGGPKCYVMEGSGNGHIVVWRLSWATWKRLTYRGQCETDEEGIWKCSVSICVN